MTKKVVFLDIDGTILNHEKEIPNATKEGIQALHDKGIIVSIATGRASFMFQDLMKELGINSYISFNGQYVVHNGEVIYDHPFELEQLEKLNAYSEKYNHPLVFQGMNEMKGNDPSHPHVQAGMESLKWPHPGLDIDFYKKAPIYQVLLFNQEHEQVLYENDFDQLRFIRWHEYSCDVCPSIGSKAHGIQKFIEALNIDWKDTYAFGDGLNDLEMITEVNTGVAMGNSIKQLKQAADYTTEDVENDGLRKGLEAVELI